MRGNDVTTGGRSHWELSPVFSAAMLLGQRQQAFPGAGPRPADEGLRGHPPWSKFRRPGAPFGAIVVPPKDCAACVADAAAGALADGRHALIGGSSKARCAPASAVGMPMISRTLGRAIIYCGKPAPCFSHRRAGRARQRRRRCACQLTTPHLWCGAAPAGQRHRPISVAKPAWNGAGGPCCNRLTVKACPIAPVPGQERRRDVRPAARGSHG